METRFKLPENFLLDGENLSWTTSIATRVSENLTLTPKKPNQMTKSITKQRNP